MTKIQNIVWNIRISDFEFVSDFVLRISNFNKSHSLSRQLNKQ